MSAKSKVIKFTVYMIMPESFSCEDGFENLLAAEPMYDETSILETTYVEEEAITDTKERAMIEKWKAETEAEWAENGFEGHDPEFYEDDDEEPEDESDLDDENID